MRRFGLTLLAGLAAALVFAQALPGPSNGRISRAGGGKPGGSAPQMQYNNGGVFGGVANFTSNGTDTIYTAESLPAAPTSGSKAFDSNMLLFPSPMRIDSFFGVPAPVGFFRTQTLSQISSSAQWHVCLQYPSQWNSTTFDVADGCLTSSFTEEGSGVSGGGWALTSLTTRIRRVGMSTISGQNWVGMHRGNLAEGLWTGNAPGLGGFIFWTRFFGATHETGDATFAGAAALTSAFVSGSRPGGQLNTAYVGADATDSNLQVCSNDGATTTCTDLGSSFPARTNGTIYDVWLAYPPNSLLPDAGTGFNYYVERIDSPAVASGTKSGNLPSSAAQLTSHVVFSSPDGGSLTTKIEISGVGTWQLW